MNLRKINMFIVIGMLAVFLAHAIGGSLILAGAQSRMWVKTAARALEVLIGLHIIITTILTIQSLRARRLSGAGYFRDNIEFWTRRISGFVILIPLMMHILIFSQPEGVDVVRLQVFTTGRLISQILLVAAIALHVLTNIRPALISFGVKGGKAVKIDLMFILSVLLLLFAAAFAIFYVRWMNF